MKTLILTTATGSEVVGTEFIVHNEDSSIDFTKTMKAILKEGFGLLKDWDISGEGKLATSKEDNSTAVLSEETIQSSMAKTLAEHAVGYVDCTSYSGGKSKNNGDTVADILEGLSPAEVTALAEHVLELATGELVEKYAHLNPGQRRMNSGNRIRGAVKKGVTTEESLATLVENLGFGVPPVIEEQEEEAIAEVEEQEAEIPEVA